MANIYKNKLLFNQRGGSLLIDNTTNQEKVKLSHRSGSNISITNNCNTELATNNKQTIVLNDQFKTVGGDDSDFVKKDKVNRVGENSYSLKGFISQEQLDAYKEWKNEFKSVALENSNFKIKRGVSGTRASNPTLKNLIVSVNNTFKGFLGIPIRTSLRDDVTAYVTVSDRNNTSVAQLKSPSKGEIEIAAGKNGSQSPGVLEFGGEVSSSTENGTWDKNEVDISQLLVEVQDKIIEIEKKMGNGGDDIDFIKRNRFRQIGAAFNDYPSIRIDEKGRSQPIEVVVGPNNGTFKNHDYIPHIEEVDNASTFPCGNDDEIVGNRLTRIVGSGGISFKTTGNIEFGGRTYKLGVDKLILNGTQGVQLASKESVDIQSEKSISLRTNRQVLVDGALGVDKNLIVNGGAYFQGETYINHITGPAEVHQTQETIVSGKFACDAPRTLVIGECNIGGTWYPVYASASDDLIACYPHSHHHLGLAMRLTTSNQGVRTLANVEGINKHTSVNQSLPQLHEQKKALSVPPITD